LAIRVVILITAITPLDQLPTRPRRKLAPRVPGTNVLTSDGATEPGSGAHIIAAVTRRGAGSAVAALVVTLVVGVLVTTVTTACGRQESARSPAGSNDKTATPLAPGDYERHVNSGGLDRSYLLHIPAGSTADKPSPLLIMFHPALSSGKRFAALTNMSEVAGKAGYVVAYPDGYRRTWNAGDCCGAAHKDGVDDVAFTKALIADIEGVVAVDRTRIYAAGFSNGGAMAYRLACEMSDQISAVAAASTAMHMTPEQCRPAKPVSILHFHGREDTIAPINGGQGSAAQETGNQQPLSVTIGHWVQVDGCQDQPETVLRRGSATEVTYPGCKDDTAVTVCIIDNMGHHWPGAKGNSRSRTGPQSYDINATQMVVEFLSKHHR
jgi:polyhydroxybutyrate depolymerase